MWFGVKDIPSTPTATRVVCPVAVTDEAPGTVAPSWAVVAEGEDRKTASARATTETTPTIAPAVLFTGAWSPAGLTRALRVGLAEDSFGASPRGAGDEERVRSATADSLL